MGDLEVMELKRLYYFLKLAECLNFTQAAKATNISQAALRYQIELLERELSVKLFIRWQRKVLLTPAGKALRKPARQILARADNLQELVRKAGATLAPPK